MGNVLGNLSTYNSCLLTTIVEPPDKSYKPEYDPMYGFPNGRKPREMRATQEEMISARISLDLRGYCAHELINFKACRKQKFPLVYKCHHEKHNYEACMYDDFVLRFKETERNRRLKEREERIAKKQAKEELE